MTKNGKQFSHLPTLRKSYLNPITVDPSPITSHASGFLEGELRNALKYGRNGRLETEGDEPSWTVDSPNIQALPFFAGWEALEPYTLPASQQLIAELIDRTQSRWDQAKFSLDIMGNGASVEGWFGIFRHWFKAHDWLTLYRSRQRTIFAWPGRTLPGDIQVLAQLEANMMSTTRFLGDSDQLLVFTCGRTAGSVDMYRSTLATIGHGLARTSLTRQLDHLAHLGDVPAPIIRDLITMTHHDCKIVLALHGTQIRIESSNRHFGPAPAIVQTKRGRRCATWEIGGGWRLGLGLAYDSSKDEDGLVATIPEMMALLHLHQANLQDLSSSPPITFPHPLRPIPHADDTKFRTPIISEVNRGVNITSRPIGLSHIGSKPRTIAVAYPRDSPWARERILWA